MVILISIICWYLPFKGIVSSVCLPLGFDLLWPRVFAMSFSSELRGSYAFDGGGSITLQNYADGLCQLAEEFLEMNNKYISYISIYYIHMYMYISIYLYIYMYHFLEQNRYHYRPKRAVLEQVVGLSQIIEI